MLNIGETIKNLLSIALIIITVFVLYGHTITFGFSWDDEQLIVRNPFIKDPAYIGDYFARDMWQMSYELYESSYYRPFYMLSFMINLLMLGPGARMFHAVNIFLIIIASLLVFALMKRVSGSLIASLFSSLLFVAHPINAQLAAWICGRVETIYIVFVLASFVFYLKAISAVPVPRRIAFYSLSVLMFAGGLFSKESALCLVPILLMYDFCCISAFGVRRFFCNMKDYTPYIIAFFAYLLLRSMLFGGFGGIAVKYLENTSPSALVLSTINSIPYYLKSVLSPFPFQFQAFMVPFVPAPDFAGIACLIFVCLFIPYYFYRYGLKYKAEIFMIGWFFIAALPIFFAATLMGVRFMALSSIGVFGFVSLYLARLAADRRGPLRIILYLMLAFAVLLYSVSSYITTFYWKDAETLQRLMVQRYPDNSYCHYNIGNIYTEEGRLSEAITEYRIALSLDEGNIKARFNLAHAYYNADRSDEAIHEFETILKQNPSTPYVHRALAVIYAGIGSYDKAIEEVKKELALNINYPKMLEFLGYLYEKKGDDRNAEIIRKTLHRLY